MTMTMDEWLARFAADLGLEPPSAAEVDQLLELAGIAAHASERPAAPVSCWLVARSGSSPAEALERARALAAPD